MLGDSGDQDGLLPVSVITTSGPNGMGTGSGWKGPMVEGAGQRAGPATERVFPMAGVFLREGEGPVPVTPNDTGEGEEPGAIEGVCTVDCAGKGGGEAEGCPFWGVRVGKLGGGGDKMTGLATLLAPF